KRLPPVPGAEPACHVRRPPVRLGVLVVTPRDRRFRRIGHTSSHHSRYNTRSFPNPHCSYRGCDMRRSRWLVAAVLATLMMSLPVGFSQDGPKDKTDVPTKKSGLPKPGEPKKHDDVTTKDATTLPGACAVPPI